MTDLQVDLLTHVDAFADLAPEWQALADSIQPAVPFNTPLWNQLWWRHHHGEGPLVHDALQLYSIRDSSGKLLAVAPMMLTERPAFGPLRWRELRFFGADPNMTEIRGCVCRPENEARILQALYKTLSRQSGTWHWFSLQGVRDPASLPPEADTGPIEAQPDYYLRLPPSWEQLRSGLSRNIKESLRKCYNSLKRDGYQFQLHVVEAVADVPAALSRLLHLHRQRSMARTSVRHNNVFADLRAQQFIAAYAQTMAYRHQLQIFELEIGGKIVASRMAFSFDRSLYLYYSGYDPGWRAYSVMTTLLAEVIKWAIERGYTELNLSTGNDISKTRWSPAEVRYHRAILCAPTPRARWAYRTYSRLARHNMLIRAALAGHRDKRR